LRSYPDLATAASAAAACRCKQRDALIAAFLSEHRQTGARVWSAAAMFAMAPLLTSLIRFVRCGRSAREDDAPVVLAAFLEATRVVGPAERLVLRLYSETRRRVFHSRRVSLDDVGRRAAHDVDALEHEDCTGIEVRLDRARFVLRAVAIAPSADERPAAYAERVRPSGSRAERRRRRALFTHQRTASLADLREALRCITATQSDGENR